MQHKLLTFTLLVLLATTFVQCKKKHDTLFQLKQAEDTGVYFNNLVVESDSFNILTYEYIYNGGGVGIADFNNDGKQDIFFTGNQVPNKLYLNQGDFKFKDVTEKASVNVPDRWNSGVVVVDINNDGWKDLYVCATTKANPEDRRNMLFVNQGVDDSGEPSFKEMANQYKIDYDGNSIMAAFFDYDRDGDLDLYILENQKLNNVPTNYRPKIVDGSAANNDRLFRNEGNGTFFDVTKEAGILYEGFGLGLAISDLNLDGWPDIYISNDYLSNDILYINNKNGTFTNVIGDFISHQSQFSMGNDAADFNNDGMPDIVTLDMLPETNARKKTTIGNKSYLTYINNEKFGYEYQYVRNMLHVNNGFNNNVKFSEVGQLAGIYQTEWSWSPLMADVDNDGYKDLLITNGFPKDITDKDFANYRADVGSIASTRFLLDSIPEVKIPNYAFKNNGDLTFSDVTKAWGMDTPSFSNGAAYADLDNDGDLDYVVNNINDIAFVYENTLISSSNRNDSGSNNYINIKLKGPKTNWQAIGAKVFLYYDSGKLQFYEQSVARGYLSSVDDVVHFGVGNSALVDSIVVQWLDGARTKLQHVNANAIVNVEHKTQTTGSPSTSSSAPMPESTKMVEKVTAKLNVHYLHKEEDKIDFNLQRTLPHKFSQSGPGICVGDIDNDGLEDFIIGGSAKNNFTVFKQRKDGTFTASPLSDNASDKIQYDQGLLLFDADGDGDLDLYIASGGIEEPQPGVYQDRFYRNDGNGNFSLDVGALPDINTSSSCVRAADYDEDGDLDLFVGGRVVPGSYPLPPESFLLKNEQGKFVNVTKEICAELQTIGMVTDALWTDFSGDGTVDLMVVGEFMPIVFFANDNGKLKKVTPANVEQRTGWWNSIVGGDFDKDGDIDYIVGNLGLNNNYQVKETLPLKIYAKDFDGNGSVDPVLACYMRESMESDAKKLYPIHFWDELNSQSPKFRNKFSRYEQFSKVTIDGVLSPEEMTGALTLEANHMASSYIQNLGNNKFEIKSLPTYTQIAPINGMVTCDVNEDGNLDVLMVGNDYGNEVFAGRYDAFTGLILLGTGNGSFSVVPSAASGFYVPGNGKGLVRLQGRQGDDLFIATQNRDSVQIFKRTSHGVVMQAKALDSHAEIIFEDGRKQKWEFYYGSGYLSQSNRSVRIPKNAKEVIIYDYQGKYRKR
jgi:hypothetical protein